VQGTYFNYLLKGSFMSRIWVKKCPCCNKEVEVEVRRGEVNITENYMVKNVVDIHRNNET